MVTKKSKYLLFIIGIILTNTAISQTDTSKLNYSEESSDSSDYKYRKVYQYLDINMKDEKRMFKMSPGFGFSSSSVSLGFQLDYEWKIKKQYSLLLRNNISFSHSKGYSNWPGVPRVQIFNNFYSYMEIEFRYYLTLKKRIESGISGNNLSGLYMELGLDDLIIYHPQKRKPETQISGVPILVQGPILSTNFQPKLSIGIQRRLNNWSFFDIYTFAVWSKGNIYVITGFDIGFAWGNKK